MDEKGKQVGLFTRDEALRKARELGLDLVEIAPRAKPSVAKIIDFKKFKYLESKREQEIKKRAKDVETKEVHVRPFIGEHDLEVRTNSAKGFLKNGHRVKIVVKLQGREFAKKDFAYGLIKKFNEKLAGLAQADSQPRWEGRFLTQILSPVKKYGKDENQKSRQQKV